MKRFIVIFTLFSCSLTLFAQKDSIVFTDSSKITTKYFQSLNSIRVFNELKNKGITYYNEFYMDTKQVKEEAVFNKYGDYANVSRIYSKDGKLLEEINQDKGLWIVYNKNEFPYYDLETQIKLKGDSFIKSIYGQGFFDKSVIWDIGNSAIYNLKESGDWTDQFESQPTKFLLSYNIRFDKDHVFNKMIDFELDSLGDFIPDEYEDIYGFEKLPDNIDWKFKLNYDYALKIAKQNGLIENDSIKVQGFLKWKGLKKAELYNGQFLFYLIQMTKTEKTEGNQKFNYKITDYYNVWIFNPWTAELTEFKKMHNIRYWEGVGGYDTGLIEDKK